MYNCSALQQRTGFFQYPQKPSCLLSCTTPTWWPQCLPVLAERLARFHCVVRSYHDHHFAEQLPPCQKGRYCFWGCALPSGSSRINNLAETSTKTRANGQSWERTRSPWDTRSPDGHSCHTRSNYLLFKTNTAYKTQKNLPLLQENQKRKTKLSKQNRRWSQRATFKAGRQRSSRIGFSSQASNQTAEEEQQKVTKALL